MDGIDTIVGYLMQTGVEYEDLGEGSWVLHDDVEHVDNIVLQYTPPLVVFTVRLMDVPADAATHGALFRKLLELNNTPEMMAGAYAIDGDGVVITETLQAENLDLNEFQAALDCLTMALSDHYEDLKAFHTAPTQEVGA